MCDFYSARPCGAVGPAGTLHTGRVSRARDPARRDIGGWGRGRRGGAKSALVMIQLAWPRSLQPLPGIVAGLFGSCRALLPGDWGVCSIRSCFTACRRRVVALLVQFPPWATVWGHGWRPGPPTHAPQSPPGPPRPRLAHPCPQAPARPTHAPRPRQAHSCPQAPPGPLMPPGPAWPPGSPSRAAFRGISGICPKWLPTPTSRGTCLPTTPRCAGATRPSLLELM